MKMVPCPEESPSGHDQNSQADIVTPAVTTKDEKPHIEGRKMSPVSQAHTSETNVEVTKPRTIPPTTPEGSDKDSCVVQSPHEGKILDLTCEKVSSASPRGTLILSPSQGGNVSSGKAEKASEDGYNWRKYGQKNVKANEFIRSYYKCTHRNCLVKKQVERSLEGQITDTVYFGQHDHPKPHINVPLAVGLVVSVVEDKPEKPSTTKSNGKASEVRGQTFHQVKTPDTPLYPLVTSVNEKSMLLYSPRSRLRDDVDNNDDPSSKRKKKENRSDDAAAAQKATGESRLTVQTASEVDIVNDGYRWRKYGQKLVKGNPNPRSYYRCSNPGCPVKKHVERASHDPKVVMTTYEGQHDHDKPTARTVTRNPGGMNVQNDEAKSEGGTVSVNAAVGEGNLDPSIKSTERQSVKFESKCDATEGTVPVCENEQKQREEETPSPCKSEGVKGDPEEPVLLRKLTGEQPNNQLAVKSEESEGICHNKVGKKSNEQQQVLNTAATVQS